MRFFIIIGLIALTISPSWGQEEEDLDEINPFDINFDEFDTTSIFTLLDSLITADLNSLKYSQLVIKGGYASQIVSAGRDLGTNQFGVNFGASYYHSSGVYADVTAYINSENSPSHYLTTASVGYLGILKNKWTYLLSYDHYFYRDPSDENISALPFTDGFGVAVYKTSGKFETGIDYSIVIGDAINAHKIYWSINGNFSKEKLWFFDKVSLLPTFGMLFGNQSVLSLRLNRRITEEFFDRRDPRFQIPQEERNVFGLLNYNLSLPIGLRYKKLNLLLSYHYNIPVSLPGERSEVENNSFIGLSASYFIDLKKNKTSSLLKDIEGL